MTLEFSKEKILQICQMLGIKFESFENQINFGSSEHELLKNKELVKITNQYCFIGVDGTSASISEEDSQTPVFIQGSAVLWGINGNRTLTITYDQRYVVNVKDFNTISSIRTILEFKMGICLAIAHKLKKFHCKGCIFKDQGCRWNTLKKKPWNEFSDKEPVIILDLPVDFGFIKTLPIDISTRDYLRKNVQQCFKDIFEHNIPVIFVTHKSQIKNISKEIASELDRAINFNDQTTILLKWIRANYSGPDSEISRLMQLSDGFKDKSLTDFDILNQWLIEIGRPTPVFIADPTEFNNNSKEIHFHYLTWGYKEHVKGSWEYLPSCWVRIGYSPFLTSVDAHLIMCMEMMLGKGHSVSLTLAHSACNLNKSYYIRFLLEYFNKERPDSQKLGINVKSLNKWRFFNV